MRFLTVLVLCCCSVVSRAAEPDAVLPLWPAGKVPGETDEIGEEKEAPHNPANPAKRVTNVTQPSLTLFRAPREQNTGAAVIVCPGGGYNYVVMDKEGTEVAQWLTSLGVNAAVLKYRVPGRKNRERHAAPLQDAQRAIGLLRHRAEEFGINSQKIGILGFSAGGHCAATASNQHVRTYPAVDAADEVSCRPDFSLLVYPAYLAVAKENDKLAPELPVSAKTPPTFLVMTQDDGVRVENCLAYYAALKVAKVPVEMHLYATGGHGYGIRPTGHAISTWPKRAEEWLRANVLK